MALAELDRFRQKYPQYNDIDDATLANKLAQKYPQYSDLRDKVGQQPSQPNSSIATQGASYLTEHPFKSAFEPAAKTLTGTSLLEKSQGSSVFNKPPTNPLQFAGEFGLGLGRDIGAMGADILSTPANVVTAPLTALKPVQMAGKAIARSKVGQGVGKVLNTPLRVMPKTIESRIHGLYNYAVGSKMKNIGDVVKVQPQRVAAMKTISDNLPDIKLTNIDTGALESRVPQNRLDLLNAFYQTKKLVFEKYNALSKGATEKGALINLSKLADEALLDTKKQIGNVALKTNPNLIQALNKTHKSINASGNISPSQSQDYMRFLNDEVKRLRDSGRAIDYSVKDLYNNLISKLGEATDDAIEKALTLSGYKDARLKYSYLRAGEKEILGAANKFLRQQGGQGGGVIHPIVNLWSIEEILKGGVQTLMGNPLGGAKSIGQAGLIKWASKLTDYFKSPDKRIIQMFKLLQKYSPK